MRSGGCAVQQALAGEAAAVMRQAVSLAQRRGHAQVTPLHVASAMVADAGGLFRLACLRTRSSSYPLQCKALELCFNVALNRLATAGAPAMFHHAGQRAPALSNALAAAFKRAQANQRRGCSASVGGQRPPGLAAKVELEQLVISILDDPSVNRVMREAGFSSAEVKANVEKAVSSEQSSYTASRSTASPNPNPKESKTKIDVVGDAMRVMDCMASGRKRCMVVVGESAAAAEGVVKEVMDKVSKGELRRQQECLKNVQFVPFSAASFQRMLREEVEARAGDLRALVREGCAAGKGLVLVLEDLGYTAEAWTAASVKRSGRLEHGNYYCPVEHAVMELSSLVRGDGRGHDCDRFWLLAFGAYPSYKNCRAGQPSLEAVLELHPVVVPDGGLALSLGGDSELTYCGTDMVTATAASVPSWLRRCQGPDLTGSELALSFSSPVASRHRSRPHQNPNPVSSNSVSYSSGGATEPAARRRPCFTELTAENLKILCSALETRVPRYRDIAQGIASAVLQRRSGVTRTTRPSSATWLLFQGRDSNGKTSMSRELARLVFGSYAEFTTIAPTDFALALSGSSSGDELSLKRQRSAENEHGYVERLYKAIRENPHRVVLINGVGRSDNDSEAGVKNAITTGTVRGCNGDVVSLEDAIVVLSYEVLESRSTASSPPRVKQRVMCDVAGKEEDDGAEKGVVPRFSLDLNACAIDGEGEGESSLDVVEILNAVDGVFFFQY
ncbi:protein SMAX1-LIKE 3-like [Phragmites australis]|uniref:protein SMAX1-LIKE 3-like n=1 Tax=Phragmites australis TaxID=29695 RepID=UPI002D769962|nr:protein SMAX1-LIKE 3-like [Phragmites australis]